jgi:chromate transporter
MWNDSAANATLTAVLTGIAAAVVGVIANLGVYSPYTLFAATSVDTAGRLRLDVPDVATMRPLALILAAAGRPDDLRTALVGATGTAACALLGLGAALAGLPAS